MDHSTEEIRKSYIFLACAVFFIQWKTAHSYGLRWIEEIPLAML